MHIYLWEWFPLLNFQWSPFSFDSCWHRSSLSWGFKPRTWPRSPFRTALFTRGISIRCGRFPMHPIPSFSISDQVLRHISFTESTGKFLPTMWMKIFPLSYDIIHQMDYVAPFDDLAVVNEFSTLVPMHGWFSLDAFQKVFCFPSEFYGTVLMISSSLTVLASLGGDGVLRWSWYSK